MSSKLNLFKVSNKFSFVLLFFYVQFIRCYMQIKYVKLVRSLNFFLQRLFPEYHIRKESSRSSCLFYLIAFNFVRRLNIFIS